MSTMTADEREQIEREHAAMARRDALHEATALLVALASEPDAPTDVMLASVNAIAYDGREWGGDLMSHVEMAWHDSRTVEARLWVIRNLGEAGWVRSQDGRYVQWRGRIGAVDVLVSFRNAPRR